MFKARHLEFIIKESFLFILFSAAVSAQNLEEYMSRTRQNDHEFELYSQRTMLSDPIFVSNCWEKLAPLSFELFYTIDINGNASDVVWFPAEINAECIRNKVLNTKFAKPKVKFYGWWLIWDGAGG